MTIKSPQATSDELRVREADPDAKAPASAIGLHWACLYLVDLAFGGPEEGGWWYQAGTMVVDPDAYESLGVGPAGFYHPEVAEAHAARMCGGLDVLNHGRPEISSVNSVGRYEVRVLQALLPTTHFPEIKPRYE